MMRLRSDFYNATNKAVFFIQNISIASGVATMPTILIIFNLHPVPHDATLIVLLLPHRIVALLFYIYFDGAEIKDTTATTTLALEFEMMYCSLYSFQQFK